ncbi:MAG: hypothetical protein ABI142_02365, partial [Bryocella sp.]
FALLVLFAINRTSTGSKHSQVPLAIAFFLFAFLLSAQQEFIVVGVRIAGHLKCVALVALWAVALKYPFELSSLPRSTHHAVPAR